jgi:DNA (cytosine-5)-methyltransferase 1
MTATLLDLFCKAGGCTRGYQEAGFHVVGVDIEPQPNYCGDEFHQGDALDVLRDLGRLKRWMTLDGTGLVAVHASPPCQSFTKYQNTGNVGEYPDLIDPTRKLLEATGLPYVIENVEGAPLLDPTLICGSMFDPPMDVRRHRLFEANWPLEPPAWPCRHKLHGPDRFPGGRSVSRTGSSRGPVRGTIEIGSWDIPLDRQQEAMGIDWMTLPELSEAIPPAYTRLIGEQLLAHVQQERVGA